MKIGMILLSMLLLPPLAWSQDTLRLKRQEAEALFLRQNLSLLSEKMNIEIQEAEVMQAKLWPNPNFTFNDVNFWATERQRGGQEEVSPPLWGSRSFGRNQQFAAELNQLILTAGKRRKLVALEQTDVARAERSFENLLRDLKFELRQLLTEQQYLQLRQDDLERQRSNIERLVAAHKRQLEKGFIAKAEYMRLKALELEVARSLYENNEALNENSGTLRNLLHISPETELQISAEGFRKEARLEHTLEFASLLELAAVNRPDIKLSKLDVDHMQRKVIYERAQAVPDVTLQMNYDRNGNTMTDFVGFGFVMDLPVFNRNQGNIKKAKLELQQAELQAALKDRSVATELARTIAALRNAQGFINNIEADYERSLDELLDSYNKNFSSRTISMLEYLDYLNAYLENKNFLLEAQKDYNNNIDKLNYIVGAELIP